MAKKTESCVDTSALIAFTDRSDTYHALFRRLFADPARLVDNRACDCGGTRLVSQALRPDKGTRLPQHGGDAVGLHLMEAQGITTCWSTDLHFGLTGVSLIIHE